MPEVGELVTSLDMAGVSLTVTWLDEELEPLWTAPAETPAYRRGAAAPLAGDSSADPATDDAAGTEAYEAGEGSRAYAGHCVAALGAAREALHDAEQRLGDLDAVAGDGDHGRGMVRGVDAAAAAAVEALSRGAGAGDVLAAAGDAWADKAGGTSGVLWGAGLRALGESLGNDHTPDVDELAAAVQFFASRIVELGKAETGDKTMVDALVPFTETFRRKEEGTGAPGLVWAEAAAAATAAAEATAALRPRKGRARPLAEKSLGTPDPGATSLAMIFRVMGPHLTAVRQPAGARS
jgi:dihydroxyacetone kinase